LAEEKPGQRPDEADHAEEAEGPVPGDLLNDVVEKRNGEHDANRRSLRDHRGRQRPELVGEELVGGVDRHGISGPFTGSQRNARCNQSSETDRTEHRKLGHSPDQRHHQQRPSRFNAVDDKASDDCRDRKQEEKARIDQSELLRAEPDLRHHGHGGKTDDGLSMKKKSSHTTIQPPFCATAFCMSSLPYSARSLDPDRPGLWLKRAPGHVPF
jgi:hypothetical protein